jgi:hypothetical protein
MNKSGFVRVCGFVFLACVLAWLVCTLAGVWQSGGEDAGNLAAALFFGGALAGAVWVVGTLLHRSRVRRARIQAGAFADMYHCHGPKQ